MDQLLKQLGQYRGAGDAVSLVQAVVALLMSFVLSLIVIYVYRKSHHGSSYSQSYAHTLVIMCTVTSIIMLIIGSNIARAFSLVGALSIIRFRSAIKEPRDVGFIFMAMAIGMACGTKFYGIAIIFTIFMCIIVFILTRFNIGSKKFSEILLKIMIDGDVDYHHAFDKVFYTYLESHLLLSIEAAVEGTLEVVYSIKLKKAVSEKDFLDALRKLSGCRRVSLLKGIQNASM